MQNLSSSTTITLGMSKIEVSATASSGKHSLQKLEMRNCGDLKFLSQGVSSIFAKTRNQWLQRIVGKKKKKCALCKGEGNI
ncbi:hypothetical protein SADUNF_Sadunf06G0214300 [Salix dunnii]|uniref:Uncharacterized protein n=1 Tax=Salix dunnii TaxID=1413687 RepID=A0A835K5T8_9ROSI|nr:hypothetical protein SADUNF_Sadunf06G0214300 [Salix dunnii]